MKTPNCTSVLASAATLLILNASARADVISVNFQGGRSPADGPSVTSTAGNVAVGNWNNVLDNWSQATDPNTSGTLLNLMDHSGANTGADIAYNSFGTWDLETGDGGGGDVDMMSGFLDNFGVSDDNHVTVSGIPYAQYDVYVYFNRTQETYLGFTASDGGITETLYARHSGATYTPGEGYLISTDDNVGDGWTTANAVRFSGFTGASFSIDNAPNPGAPPSPGGYKSVLQGIQIVAVPEPSGLGMLGLGAAVLLLVGRCRKALVSH